MVEPQSKWWSHKCWTSSSLPHAAPNEASGDLTNAEQPLPLPPPPPPHGGTIPLPSSLLLHTVVPPLSPPSSLLHTVGPTEQVMVTQKVITRPRVLCNLAVKMYWIGHRIKSIDYPSSWIWRGPGRRRTSRSAAPWWTAWGRPPRPPAAAFACSAVDKWNHDSICFQSISKCSQSF